MKQWKKMPLFKKAEAILNMVEHIVKSVENTDIDFEGPIQAEMIKSNLDYMIKNAMIIPAKIAGVSGEDMLYDIKMENAAIIRRAAREIITDTSGVQLNGYQDIEYLNLLRNEINEFRVLFAEWVKTFDQWNYTIDRWGLFNPPGISYDAIDPNDDIPFDADDFLKDL